MVLRGSGLLPARRPTAERCNGALRELESTRDNRQVVNELKKFNSHENTNTSVSLLSLEVRNLN
jgi:hypothetical protein